MKKIVLLHDIQPSDLSRVGGKALSLAQLARNGFRVSDTLCVTTEAYLEYISVAGLRERILLELYRKATQDLRWEEVWDSALRIRNMFLKQPMPEELYQDLKTPIEQFFGDKAVVVRSSAPSEDSAGSSFAGLHESYVNVKGVEAILEHLRLVWASLWSDAAMMYRQELGLDVESSAMAVVIQEIVQGERSGVAFSQSPTDASQAVLEAIYGLNQGLVDGVIEPDRWIFERSSGQIVSYTPATKKEYMLPAEQGVHLASLPQQLRQQAVLKNEEAQSVFHLAKRSEDFYGRPQDVEWSFRETELYVLQSRPITTVSTPSPQDDRRQWDLSLRRSFENLKVLRKKIEDDEIPAMITEADRLAEQSLEDLSQDELAREIERRSAIFHKWNDVYWADFIPFAHGIRLFGQVYNDTVQPEDPYEFVQLLQATRLQSLERNRMLTDLAVMIRQNPRIAESFATGYAGDFDRDFDELFQRFLSKFGDLSHNSLRGARSSQEQQMLIKVLREMAQHPPAQAQPPAVDTEILRERYLNAFKEGEQRAQASEILALGRVSYQLRDDDNIYLGRIEDQLQRAANEGRKRLEQRGLHTLDSLAPEEIRRALKDFSYIPRPPVEKDDMEEPGAFSLRGRQLIGQPAGPGLAKAEARIILSAVDLAEFTSGEILVCDAVDPTMTFVVPLAAAIVERRGGMLIHGAIIAREYGLPCVTGVPDVTQLIQTGDTITVDGYLGIVTLD